jgi:hypothetical protein
MVDPGVADADRVISASAALGMAQALVLTLEGTLRQLREEVAALEEVGDGVLRQENAQLRAALATRGVIEQAKGILMARHGYDAETAFKELAQRSTHQRTKVRQIAERLVHEAVATPLQHP